MSTAENVALEPSRWMNLGRPVILGTALSVGLMFITALHYQLPVVSIELARLLLDYEGSTYPYSVQNIMWLVFFLSLGELYIRDKAGRLEAIQLQWGYLPEDERTLLEPSDLGAIYRHVKGSSYSDQCFLPRLIKRAITQFQTTRSVDQTNSLLNSSLELYIHEIDLRYNMLRYYMWFIPSLGFIGTVIGISLALNYAGNPANQGDLLLVEVTARLAVAFNTTLLALVMSSILVLLINLTQVREERALNRAGEYCMDNLINRLYVN